MLFNKVWIRFLFIKYLTWNFIHMCNFEKKCETHYRGKESPKFEICPWDFTGVKDHNFFIPPIMGAKLVWQIS